jgi:hypothetical protein
MKRISSLKTVMERIEALFFGIMGLISLTNAYQMIGTDYHGPYNVWVTVAIIFCGTGVIKYALTFTK